IRDGDLTGDPMYRGETAWYNPLVASVVATGSWVSGAPVHRVYVRLGAFLNLLAPLGLFVLVSTLSDGWTALASVVGFLFVVNHNAPSWACATYSPWLITANFAQSLFY